MGTGGYFYCFLAARQLWRDYSSDQLLANNNIFKLMWVSETIISIFVFSTFFNYLAFMLIYVRMISNITTIESKGDVYAKAPFMPFKPNPFDKGIIANVCNFFDN